MTAIVSADSVNEDIVRAIVQDVFGMPPLHSRFLGSGSGNVVYLVTVPAQDRYVIRFNRGFRDDLYDVKVENYQLVQAATGVWVPDVIAIDRTHRFVATSYMVLEYLDGVEATSLWQNSTGRDRRQIRTELGRFYPSLHAQTRPAAADMQADHLLLGVSQIPSAVDKGCLDVDLDSVAQCERVIGTDPAVHPSTLSLCMSDGEIYFERRNGAYEIAFVCDLEWMSFSSNRLTDLGQQIMPGTALWEHDEPVHVEPDELRTDSFFTAYEETSPIDYSALRRVALYTQLSTWGLIAAEPAEPAKKRWIREYKNPVIQQLVQHIAAMQDSDGDGGIWG